MFCASCGSSLAAGATFCANCGSSLEETSSLTKAVPAATELASPDPAKPAYVDAYDTPIDPSNDAKRVVNPDASDTLAWALAGMPLIQLLSVLLLANFENIGALYSLAQWDLPLSWLFSVAFVIGDNNRTRVLGNCLATFTAVVLPIVYLIVRAASLKRGWAIVATYSALWLVNMSSLFLGF